MANWGARFTIDDVAKQAARCAGNRPIKPIADKVRREARQIAKQAKKLKSARNSSVLEADLELQLKAERIPYEKEIEFCPGRKWRFDFLLPLKVAVECDGAVWSNGRHNRGAGYIADMEKLNTATILGYRVLRICAEHIKSGQAISWIKQATG